MFKKIKTKLSLTQFALIISGLNFVLFHYPFFKFVFNNTDYTSFGGILLIISLIIIMIIANAFTFFLFFSLSRRISKILLCITFLLNAIAVYFINTYGIIIDESMISNVFNTNTEESSSYFSWKLVVYIIFLGVIPCFYIAKTHITKLSFKKSATYLGASLLFMLILAFANASNWLWIDKHSKQLGGLAMPWSYSVNTALYHIHKMQANQKEIKLPDATISDNQKAVMVLVIGESARRDNFSLYGYKKNTNPLLSKVENLAFFNATSCATYTTAGVKCILEHTNSGDLYEILPNYLFRNQVDVVWRTSNWGEPPVHIEEYISKSDLTKLCNGNHCDYDGVLAQNLKERIRSSQKDKILIVLHTSTSHGPSYNKKYPPEFEVFKPVCNSVEPSNCSQEELINAYDNTIVYTDYILNDIISQLKELEEYKSSMIFVSDHGESLGEKNLYMHGLPMSLAPKQQYEIPFIVWTNSQEKPLKNTDQVTQHHVFHSVLNFLSVKSPIYNEDLNLFK